MKNFLKFLFLMIAFLSLNCFVKALDERPVLSKIEATSNFDTISVYGATIEKPTFNITTGSEAHFATEEDSAWYRYDGQSWLRITDGYRFNSGRWHYRVQVSLDGEESSSLRLGNQTKIIINGEEWTFSYCSSCSEGSNTVGWATSPNYNIDASGNLEFFSKETYYIYTSYIDTAIYTLSVANTVEGGTPPYSFSKTSGPDWINVSESGNITGTPTVVGENEPLVVRVTDEDSNYKEITIPVARTALPPEQRELITNIIATSNTSSIPVLGSNIVLPTFTVTNIEGPFFTNYNCGWYKKTGDNWKKQEVDKFTAGVWQYRTEVVLQGQPAESKRLGDETIVQVDGVDWNAEFSGVGNEFYSLSVKSPEYTIKDKINSIELEGLINEPKIGDNIEEPSIWVSSINGDDDLINIADVEVYWQYKTGDGLFDWTNASGKFEAGKIYHIRLLVTINSEIYDINIVPTFPVTFNNYNLTQFQLNDKTVGEFVEFPELKELSIPDVNIVNDNNKVTLTWNSQGNATKFKIYRSLDNKKWNKVVDITDNSYVDKGLTYGKTYYYKVKACDTTKCTGYSSVVNKKIKPNKVVLSIKSARSNNIKLGWEKVSTTGYEVYRSTDNKKWTKVTTITKNNTLEYNNKKLKDNKKYYYKVRAYKKVGSKKIYGSWSNVVSTKTAPKMPILKISLRNYNAMNLDISATKGATKYIVQRSTDTKVYELIEELPKEGRLVIGNQEVGKTYYFSVKACNSQDRCSGWSKVSLKQTTKTPKISLTTSSKKVTVTVSSVEGADGYRVYRATSKNGKYEMIMDIKDPEELTFNDKTTKGKIYYYKVRSYKVIDGSKIYSPFSEIKNIRSK